MRLKIAFWKVYLGLATEGDVILAGSSQFNKFYHLNLPFNKWVWLRIHSYWDEMWNMFNNSTDNIWMHLKNIDKNLNKIEKRFGIKK